MCGTFGGKYQKLVTHLGSKVTILRFQLGAYICIQGKMVQYGNFQETLPLQTQTFVEVSVISVSGLRPTWTQGGGLTSMGLYMTVFWAAHWEPACHLIKGQADFLPVETMSRTQMNQPSCAQHEMLTKRMGNKVLSNYVSG